MRAILVAGGAGYIGSHMVRRLLEAGYEPVVFDNLSTGHREFVPQGVPFVNGDLRDASVVTQFFKSFRVDAVMHFAASSLVGESVQNPLKYYDNNVSACITLLSEMQKYGIDRLIFSSTAAVYGQPDAVPITEDAPTRPTNPYGSSKLMIETMLRDAARSSGIRYIALRYFNACGAHESGEIGERHEPETHLIPNILKAAARETECVQIFGDDYPTPDGTCVRDYIDVRDLCDAHLLALEALGAGRVQNEAFNLGNGNGYSVKQIIAKAEEITGRRIPVRIGARRPGDPAVLVASAEKARRALGWMPHKDLNDILQNAWKWHQSYELVS